MPRAARRDVANLAVSGAALPRTLPAWLQSWAHVLLAPSSLAIVPTLAAGNWAPPLDAATLRLHSLWRPLNPHQGFVRDQALAVALRDGAAPELILLDMRGNPLSEAATTVLVRPPTHFCKPPVPCSCRSRVAKCCLSTRRPRQQGAKLHTALTTQETYTLTCARRTIFTRRPRAPGRAGAEAQAAPGRDRAVDGPQQRRRRRAEDGAGARGAAGGGRRGWRARPAADPGARGRGDAGRAARRAQRASGGPRGCGRAALAGGAAPSLARSCRVVIRPPPARRVRRAQVGAARRVRCTLCLLVIRAHGCAAGWQCACAGRAGGGRT
jgi:hypothetical protein